MDQVEVRAYETLGWWTTTVVYVHLAEDGTTMRGLVYRGDHSPIDDQDPEVRTVLLLHQALSDLEDSMAVRNGTNRTVAPPVLAARADW